MENLIEVQNLKKYFKTRGGLLHAVDDVSSVSYTPLDVYKRQALSTPWVNTSRNL